MANSKTYLNVPFVEKDAAKALGAKWDPANKKWYVPANIDVRLFAKWNTESESPSTASQPKTQKPVGGMTYPSDKNFVVYSGDEPPWNLT